jgi:hypothetical protein
MILEVTIEFAEACEKAGLVVRKHIYDKQRTGVNYTNYVLFEGTEDENWEDVIVIRTNHE